MKTMKKTHWLRNTLIVLIICGILGTIISLIQFFGNPEKTYAGATLLLSFNGAGDGVAPNGNEYDINEARLDEVLENALEKAEMADKYTAEQLRDNLVITGAYPEDITEQVLSFDSLLDFAADRKLTVTDYYPTEYSIVLYNTFDSTISDKNLTALVKSITEAYREYFVRKYSVKWDNEIGMAGLASLDYTQQMTVLSQNLTQASRFVNEMYTKEPAFKAGGIGFNDILARLQSLNTNEVSRLEASIVQNALTKQENRLLTQYRYQIETWSNQKEHMEAELKELEALIAGYEKGEIIYLSTSSSLNQVGGTSSTTYDTLVRRRTDIVAQINRISTNIARVQKRIEELVGTGAVSEEAAAEVIAAAEEATAETAESGAAPEGEATETVSAETAQQETVTELSNEEKAELHAQQTAELQGKIDKLVKKQDEVIADLNTLLTAYNEEEMTEGTIRLLSVKAHRPKILSGAFVKQTIKVAGPICAVGFMVCLILLIRSRRKEEKEAAAA